MRILVVAEHDSQTIRSSSRCAIGFANAVAEESKGSVECLVIGHNIEAASDDAAHVAPVVAVDSESLAKPVADRLAKVIVEVTKQRQADLVVAASTTYAKDIVGRAAGLLGGAMASDVIAHAWRDGRLVMRRPMYAGAVIATVALTSSPQIVTIRSSSYSPAGASREGFEITKVDIDETILPNQTRLEQVESKANHRPDVTESRVVVSGGRAIKNSEDYESLVGGLADALQGATGSSRALVDAGVTSNDLQVGQTGKIVAPELYVALGISGAVQHLAGMKNSQVIVAINNDPEAPIFEVADYGLVGDVYELVPLLIKKLNAG